MPENKTKATTLSVTAYIEALTDPTRRSDAKELVQLMQRASGEKPRLWGPSIVGFGSYHYRYESGREGDMPLISFSPRKAAMVSSTSTLAVIIMTTASDCRRRIWRSTSRPDPSGRLISNNTAFGASASNKANAAVAVSASTGW